MAANIAKEKAMVSGDAAALERFYTADYHVIDDDGNVHDKRNQVEFTTSSVDLLAAVSDDVKVHTPGENAALLTGRLSGRYRMDGNEAAFVQRYTSIWVREAKDWRVKHEHASTVPKPR